jgi:RNA polymerase sigma factor (TIGR02999 family)
VIETAAGNRSVGVGCKTELEFGSVENQGVEPHDVTQLLVSWSRGDRSALDQLTPLLYEELRRLASAHLRRGRKQETIQPTTLVHEVYLRMAGQDGLAFENRAQFFGLAAQVMRSILVDHARSRSAAKRGGGGVPLTLQDHLAVAPGQTTDILALHEALEALAQQDDRKARIIEMRYFAGMTTQEIADATETSVATVGREIRVAHAWLLRRMRH